MKRVTRQGIKADRVACPGLIRNFVDREAEFVFLPQALRLLAEMVRAADSHPVNPHPAGQVLRWIAHGFSALGWSDHEIPAREFEVYDALYAGCRRRVGGGDDT